MAIPRAAWGIDIGNRALKAIKLTRDGGQLRIDDFEIIEHEQILSNAGDNKESLLQTALANFVQRHETKGAAVAVNVSGQSSFARFIKLPPVEPRKIPEIVRFEAIQQIPFPLDDVEWAYQLFQDPESPEVEVGIFAMRKDLVNRQIAYFTDLGLNVQVVQMNPLAVYNAMQYDDQVQGTTMFMDMGAENTDLIIAEGQTVWLRSLPIGGNNFTESLAKSFKLNFAKAEELKRNAATSKYARQIFQAMRPVFADLVAEVQRSIGFYASVHRDARIKRIVALGGTFRLPGLQKYLQQNLTLDVERIDRFAAGKPADSKAATNFSENILSLASAYGLAVQAMGDAKITSSLLPARIRRLKTWQEKTKWFAAAAALFLVATAGVGTRLYLDKVAYDQNDKVRDNIQRTLSTGTSLSNDWREVEEQGGDDRVRIQNIVSLQEHRTLWPDLLADIYSALPKPQADTWEKITATPRPKRNQIVISSITSTYLTDVETYVPGQALMPMAAPMAPVPMPGGGGDGGWGPPPGSGWGPPPGSGWGPPAGNMGAPMGPDMGGAPAAGPAVPATPAPKRGFVVTIKGFTPNEGNTTFVENTLIANLKKLTANAAPATNKPYYIEKVELTDSRSRAPAPGGAPAGGWGGGAMLPGIMLDPAAAGGAGPGQVDPNIDRLTNEPMTGDTEFEYRVYVRFDPTPPPKTDDEAGK